MAVGLFALASAIVGCGGGGGSSASLPSGPSGSGGGGAPSTGTQRAMTKFTIKIPGHGQTASNARKPSYISASTQGVEIDLISTPAPGASPAPAATQIPQMTAAISPTSAGCTTPGTDGSYSCAVNAYIPVGTNQYVVALLDRVPTGAPPAAPPYFPAGTNVLSYASVSFTVANNTTNTIPLTLNGLIAGFAITPSLVTVPNAVATSVPVTVTAYDADSNIIIGAGNYDVPLTVAISDTNRSLTFAGNVTSVSLTAPGPPLFVNYNGGALTSGVITATAHGLTANVSVLPVAANAVTIPLGNSGGSATLAGAGGIRTFINLPANNAAAGTTITLGSQVSAPSGVGTLGRTRIAASRPVPMVSGGTTPTPFPTATPTATPTPAPTATPTPAPTPTRTPTPTPTSPGPTPTATSAVPTPTPMPTATPSPVVLQYIGAAPSNRVTFNGAPAFTFTGTFDAATSYYIGFYDPSNPSAGITTIEGPGIVSGSTLVFSGTSVPLTLPGGLQSVFVLYSSGAPAPVPTAPIGIGIGIPSALSQALYVTDSSSGTGVVSRFAANALGTPSPTFTLASTNPSGIAFGPNAYMYITSSFDSVGGVRVYAPDTKASPGAYGASPIGTLTGPNTQLVSPSGANTDTFGNLYVSDVNDHAILVFAAGANGDVAPVRTISGPATNLVSPLSVVVDQSNNVWVSDIGPPQAVYEFAAGSAGNVAPSITISGANTGLRLPTGVTLDYAGDVIVADGAFTSTTPTLASAARSIAAALRAGGRGKLQASSNGVIDVYAPPFAPGTNNVAPARRITGANTGLFWPGAVVADVYGNIAIASGASIEVFAPNANGNASPIKVISGAPTGLVAPFGIAVSPVQP